MTKIALYKTRRGAEGYAKALRARGERTGRRASVETRRRNVR
jgi:hypothetical protein